MKRITITIDDETLEILRNISHDNRTSMSQMIRRLVLEESKRNNKKVD